MREITSAAANKLLRSLEDEKNYLLSLEEGALTYVLAEGEKCEKPEYDYEETARKLKEIDEKVRKVKHAINIFNVTTKLPGLAITVDEALVKMAQLNKVREKLDGMRKRLPKTRNTDGFMQSHFIEYIYVNYDLKKVQEDYRQVCGEISQIQLELDLCNQTVTFPIDVEL